MNATRILEILARNGVDQSALAAAKDFLKPRKSCEMSGEPCIACGQKTLRLDYICGTCSQLKLDNPKRFWSWVYSREAGGDGRPKPQRALPQELPPQTERKKFEYLRDVSDAKDPEPLPRYEFLVRVGQVGRVVVAELAFEAIRCVKSIHGIPETASHYVLCLGQTDAEHTDARSEAKDWTDASAS